LFRPTSYRTAAVVPRTAELHEKSLAVDPLRLLRED
jgi:hypothetical protein